MISRNPERTIFTIEQLRYSCGAHQVGPINLTLSSDTAISISGASGSGKTLFLRALTQLDHFEGAFYLNSQSHTTIPAPQWRTLVGMLPSESQWWFDSVGEHFQQKIITAHLTTPKSTVHDFEFQHYCKILNLSADCFSWPIKRLSSGEKQRLALIRLLQNKPKVLLLDEITTNMDPDTVRCAETIIQEYCEQHNACVIWISHDELQRNRVAYTHYHLHAGQLKKKEQQAL